MSIISDQMGCDYCHNVFSKYGPFIMHVKLVFVVLNEL